MTETTDFTATPEGTDASSDDSSTARGRRRSSGSLSGLVLPQLQQVAQQLGITGIARMRKSQLIEAIEAAQGSGTTARAASQAQPAAKRTRRSQVTANRTTEQSEANGHSDAPVAENGQLFETPEPKTAAKAGSKADAKADAKSEPKADAKADAKSGQSKGDAKADSKGESPKSEQPKGDSAKSDRSDDRGDQEGREQNGRRDNRRESNRDRDGKDRESNGNNGNKDNPRNNRDRDSNRDNNRDSNRDNNRDNRDRDNNRDDDSGDGRGRRRRRSRDRFRERGGSGGSGGGGGNRRERYDPEPQLSEDDVVIPVAGILDVLDNYAFVRTSGFLPGSNDVYVSLAMVKKYGLRKGDAVSGAIRQPREGERREKFNPLVRVDTVNGADPEVSKQRPEFNKLTPLYPQERLRLETDAANLTGRVIDLVSPIGKGQRGMIVSPSKAGKTLIMQSIANSITTNNPEVHLMVVLVDERPEEVTDFQRAVKGEVIASTFDRPADDHTTVAELAIERAKRLVELGHDVVVLLDGITRLGRAYNLAAPASGRILSGGVDSSALYPPKKFFGAARNIENGGSLTILATALVETGSKMDEVIFEEFKGTGNMEVRLKRDYADKRIFPAIDVDASSTRREELLMGREELGIVWKLRRVLGGLEGLQSLELLLDKLKQTKSNVEFLMQINKTMPTVGGSSSRDDD